MAMTVGLGDQRLLEYVPKRLWCENGAQNCFFYCFTTSHQRFWWRSFG